MSVINSDTQSAWQQIARDVSRQRPYVGRTATVVRGRKMLGRRVTVVRHQLDQYDRDAFRYGGEASKHMTEMRGRHGFVCLVRDETGTERWVKAEYLACDHEYNHWTAALADALLM